MTNIVMNVHNTDFFSKAFIKNFRGKNQKWVY